MWVAALECGGGGDPEGSFYRARAWPELRNAQEGPRGTAERKRGLRALGWKAEAVSEAEEIKVMNARVN